MELNKRPVAAGVDGKPKTSTEIWFRGVTEVHALEMAALHYQDPELTEGGIVAWLKAFRTSARKQEEARIALANRATNALVDSGNGDTHEPVVYLHGEQAELAIGALRHFAQMDEVAHSYQEARRDAQILTADINEALSQQQTPRTAA